MNRAELSEEQKREVERDAAVDHQDGVTRTYKGDALTDFVFGPVDMLLGDPNSGDMARARQEYYDELKAARERR